MSIGGHSVGDDFVVIIGVKDVNGDWVQKRKKCSAGKYPSGSPINLAFSSADNVYVKYPCLVRLQFLPLSSETTEDVSVISVQGLKATVYGWTLTPIAAQRAFDREVAQEGRVTTFRTNYQYPTSYFASLICEAQITQPSGFVCAVG